MLTNYLKFYQNILYNSILALLKIKLKQIICITLPIAYLFIYI